jgi:hypothetical protein
VRRPQVVYFDDLVAEAERASNLVVLDPTYVADKFQAVLFRFDLKETPPPPPTGQSFDRWQRLWDFLRYSGRMHEELLSSLLWASDFATRGATTLRLLQRLDLLCPLPDPPPPSAGTATATSPSQLKQPDPGPWYFVPAVPLYFCKGRTGQLPPQAEDQCFAALDFDSFLPHGWFSRLLLHGTRRGLWTVGELRGWPGTMNHVAVVKLHVRQALSSCDSARRRPLLVALQRPRRRSSTSHPSHATFGWSCRPSRTPTASCWGCTLRRATRAPVPVPVWWRRGWRPGTCLSLDLPPRMVPGLAAAHPAAAVPRGRRPGPAHGPREAGSQRRVPGDE